MTLFVDIEEYIGLLAPNAGADLFHYCPPPPPQKIRFIIKYVLSYTICTSYVPLRSKSLCTCTWGLQILIMPPLHLLNWGEGRERKRSTGARVAIHNPDITPLMKTESMAVPTGEATFLAITRQVLHRLGDEFSNCSKTWPKQLKLNSDVTQSVYTTARCINYCTLNKLLSTCGCVDSYDFDYSSDTDLLQNFDNGKFNQCSSTNETTRKCLRDVYKQFATRELKCPCFVPCNTTEYTYKASRSQWPSPAYSSYFASHLIKEQVPRVAAYFRKLNSLEGLTKKHIHNSMKENFVRLEIFYESTRYHIIKETKTYTHMDLLSDFGGSVSLWLGWSIFAVLELIIFLVQCIEALYIKKYRS